MRALVLAAAAAFVLAGLLGFAIGPWSVVVLVLFNLGLVLVGVGLALFERAGGRAAAAFGVMLALGAEWAALLRAARSLRGDEAAWSASVLLVALGLLVLGASAVGKPRALRAAGLLVAIGGCIAASQQLPFWMGTAQSLALAAGGVLLVVAPPDL